MTSIENTELRGITARLLYAVIASTVTIVAGGMIFYYGLKFEIMDLKNQVTISKVQFDTLKVQVDKIQIQLDQLIADKQDRKDKE